MACHQAIKEKRMTDQIIMRVVFHGIPQSGTTTLIKRLTGKKEVHIDTEVSQTQAMKGSNFSSLQQVRNSIIRISTDHKWFKITNLHDRTALLVNDIFTSTPFSTSMKEPAIPQDVFELSCLSEVTLPQNAETVAKFDPIQVLLTSLKKGKGFIGESDWSNPFTLFMFNTHGHSEIVPALSTGPSLVLLVFRYDWDLDWKHTTCVDVQSPSQQINPQPLGHVDTPVVSQRELLMHSLSNVVSTNGYMKPDCSESVMPKVIFIGTHKDLATPEHLLKVDKELQEMVKSIDSNGEVVVFASEHSLAFAVDNLSDSEEDFKQIRDAVYNIGTCTDDYRFCLPCSWMIFNTMLAHLHQKVLSNDTCLQVGKLCGIASYELNTVLQFLHTFVGSVYHFQKIPTLKGIIPDVLYIICKVYDLINQKAIGTVDEDASEEFQKTGVLSHDLLQTKETESELLTAQLFITVLRKLHVVFPIKKNGVTMKYFMPGILTYADNLADNCDSNASSLFVAFKGVYSHSSLFGFIVSFLLSKHITENSYFDWELKKGTNYQNQTLFCVGTHIVCYSFLPSDNCIRIDLITKPDLGVDVVCNEAQQRTKTCLKEWKMTSHTGKRMEYSYAFICPEHKNHAANIKFYRGDPVHITCSVSGKRFDLPVDCKLWFNEKQSRFDKSGLKYLQENFRKHTLLINFINTPVCEVTAGYCPSLSLKLGETWKERTLEEVEQLRITLSSHLETPQSDELIKTYEIVAKEDEDSFLVTFLIPMSFHIHNQFNAKSCCEFLFTKHVLVVLEDDQVCLDLEKFWREWHNVLLSAVLTNDAVLVKKVLDQFPEKELIGCLINCLPNKDSDVPGMYMSLSPLMISCGEGNHSVVITLLKNKASDSVKFQNEAGVNALHVACQRGDRDIVELLISVNNIESAISAATTEEKITPLHYAAMHESSDIVNLLINKGCDVQAQDAEGSTALHVAFKRYSRANQKVLSKINKGKLLEMKNKGGKLPFEMQLESELVIPPEIERRGKDVVEKFMKTLRKGKMKVPCCNLLILGEERIGKTSLYKRLTRQGFDPAEEITYGIANMNVTVVQNWEENKVSCQQDENNKLIAQAIHDGIELIAEDDPQIRQTKSDVQKKLENIFMICDDSSCIFHKQPASDVNNPVAPQNLSLTKQEVHKPKSSPIPNHSKTFNMAKPNESDSPKPYQLRESTTDKSSDKVITVEDIKTSVSTVSVEDNTTYVPTELVTDHESSRVSESLSLLSSPSKESYNTTHSDEMDVSIFEQSQPVDSRPLKIQPSINRHLGSMFLKKQGTKLTLNVFDFAGQTEYYAMHNCFIMKEAMYVVAFNIVDMVKYLRNKGMSTNPVQRVRYWLLSLHSHIDEDDDEHKQRVILVGTHKRSVLDRDLYNVHRLLENELCNDPRCITYLRYINVSENNERPHWRIYLAVENSLPENHVKSSTDECDRKDGIYRLRFELEQLTSQLKFLKEDRPIMWLDFESRLMSYRTEDNEDKPGDKKSMIDTKEAILKLAAETGITDPEEQELLLQYLHDTGKIVLLGHKSNELDKFVILDPKRLIEVMRAIVELNTSNCSTTGVPIQLVKPLKTEGVASEKLLRKCWSDFYSKSDDESFHQLCQVFLAYNLIFAINDPDSMHPRTGVLVSLLDKSKCQEFLVPCQLPKNSLMVEDESENEMLTFYFDFQRFLPEQIYHRFVCELLAVSQKQPETLTWMQTIFLWPFQKKKKPYYLSSNFCQFDNIDECLWRIKFERDTHTLKVSVQLPDSKDQKQLSWYIKTMHKKLLMICKASKLHGLEYIGGPLLHCCVCNKTAVLGYVGYSGGKSRPSIPECSNCLTRYDVEEVLLLQVKDKLNVESAVCLTTVKEEHIPYIMEILTPHAKKWKLFGKYLGFTVNKLESIAKKKSRVDNVFCLDTMIKEWVQGSRPTLEAMEEALLRQQLKVEADHLKLKVLPGYKSRTNLKPQYENEESDSDGDNDHETIKTDIKPVSLLMGRAISATEKWDLRNAKRPTPVEVLNGKGITIAILDTGIDVQHAAFRNNKMVRKIEGQNFIANEHGKTDDDAWDVPGSHGTMAAFVAAGSPFNGKYTHQNKSLNVPSGVAPMANLFICRVARSKDDYPLGALISALDTLIKRKEDGQDLDIVSMSFGAIHNYRNVYQKKVKERLRTLVYKHDVICVAAVGNYGDNKPVLFPACLDYVISVGALNSHNKDRLSNPGRDNGTINVYAPGEAIVCPHVCNSKCDGHCTSDLVELKDGSSCATPAIAGLAALVLQCKKDFLAEVDKQKYEEVCDPQFLREEIFDGEMAKGRSEVLLNPVGFFLPLLEKYDEERKKESKWKEQEELLKKEQEEKERRLIEKQKELEERERLLQKKMEEKERLWQKEMEEREKQWEKEMERRWIEKQKEKERLFEKNWQKEREKLSN